MTGKRSTTLFFEIFSSDLPRHGPGDTASTLKALDIVPRLVPAARLLDVGCGTGAQTLVLAHTPANIVAVDNCPLFVDELSRRAEALGIVDRHRRSRRGHASA